MNSTLKEQQQAVSDAMSRRSFELRQYKGRGLSADEHMADPEWSKLNDAASTIAAVRLSPKLNNVELINALRPFQRLAEERLSSPFKSEEIIYQFNEVKIIAHDLAIVLEALHSKK